MSFLSQQIGPLPGGAWVGLIGGAVGVSYLARRKRTATAAAVSVPATTAQDQSSLGAVQYADALGSGTTSYGTAKPATNEEWATQAVAYLVGNGLSTASKATNAISHVLYPDAANPTSPEDSALYNSVVGKIGPPPSLPSQAFIPDPPATPGPAPVFSGSGYFSPGSTKVASGQYVHIENASTAQALVNSGQQLYFEPTPGVFLPAIGPMTGNTALYQKVA
jgi:hypothetical protein